MLHELATYGVVWLSATDCDRALDVFALYRLSHNAGLLDVLIGQTAVALDMPLHTFNQRHYSFFPGIQTVQPYAKSGRESRPRQGRPATPSCRPVSVERKRAHALAARRQLL